MLSNNNNNSKAITLFNYEEFFVLYTDNELSKEEADMVEAFLAEHPELRIELDLLLQTKLSAEPIAIDKTELLSPAMRRINLDEEMLLHLDGELQVARVAALEQQLGLDERLRVQWNQLQQTKLDPSEKIFFPNKEILYRHTATVVTGIRVWWRVAAVIVLFLAMGIVYWVNSSKERQQPSLAARNLPGAVAPKVRAAADNTSPGKVNEENVAIAQAHHEISANPLHPAQKHEHMQQSRADVQAQSLQQLAVNNTKEQRSQQSLERARFIPTTSLDGTVASLDVNPSAISHSPVTSALHQTYNNTESSTNETAQFVDHDDRKGSLKGFLRKATRMIEKRTGLGVASSDDESLLVGAVELKLK